MGDEMKHLFGDLTVGQKFEVWGDCHLNYSYPKICRCEKMSDDAAREIGGTRFLMHASDEVFSVENEEV